jgi:hypothetical protein
MNTLQWDDTVKTTAQDSPQRTDIDRTMSELDTLLKTKAESQQIRRFDSILDLTSLGAQSIAVVTLPAASRVQAAWMHITETVVSGGSTAKMGLGPTGTKNKYGATADLVAGTKTKVPLATLLTTSEAVLLQAVQTDGTTAGGTNITAGKVRVVIEYMAMDDLV